LEWTYSGLSPWARHGATGGEMQFGQLPNGAWFITRWELRAPVGRIIIARADTTYDGTVTRVGRVTQVLTSSGEVVAVFDSTGAVENSLRR
jgi:hypothetical protein